MYLTSNYSCWYNSIGGPVEVKILGPLTSSIVELSHDFPYILCQDVLLVAGRQYWLNFSVYNQPLVMTSKIILKVNGNSVFNYSTLTSDTFSNANYNFIASTNSTQFCFDSTFTLNPYSIFVAPCLDNITLTEIYVPPNVSNNTNQTNLTNLTNLTNANLSNHTLNMTNSSKLLVSEEEFKLDQLTTWGVSLFLSFPIKIITSLRCLYLLVDDLWLYDISTKNYSGLVLSVFDTITTVQLLKFEFLERYLGWNSYKNWLGLSNYKKYSAPRFVEVEGTSSVFLDSNFAFFIYTVPQNILFCLTVYLFFHLLHKYRMSKYIRKFYFIKTVLAIAFLQENLAYFIFVCFSNLGHPFSFRLADKLSLSFTVISLFALLFFAFCFYLLIYKYLGKRASYFSLPIVKARVSDTKYFSYQAEVFSVQ